MMNWKVRREGNRGGVVRRGDKASQRPTPKDKKCDGCPLLFAPGPVEGEGPTNAALWVLGGAAEEADLVAGRPFRGPSGRTARFTVKAAGLDDEAVRFDYAARCVVKGPVPPGAMEYCLKAWKGGGDGGDALKGKTVLALGEEVVAALTGDLQRRPIKQWRGAIIEGDPTIVPTLAPGYITAGQWHMMHLAKADAAKAARVAAGTEGNRVTQYVTTPTPDEARVMLDPGDTRPLVLDIETVMDTGEITMCGVSRSYGHVLALPWREPYKHLLRAALQGPATKVAHNAGFDMPRLAQALGLDQVAGPWFDTLEAHALCYGDLPHNLESVASMWYDKHPWKAQYRTTKAISQELYNCMDVDATMAAFHGLTATMEELGVRSVFDKITMPAVPIMIHMHEVGIRLDRRRVNEAKAYFDTKATMAQEVMDDFVMALPGRQRQRDALCVEADRLDEEAEALWVPGTKRAAGKMRTQAKRLRAQSDALRSVSANSHKQLQELLFREMGLPPRGSTDEDNLVSLLALTRGTGRSAVSPAAIPLLRAILDYRKAAKVVSTYLSYDTDHLHPRFLLWGTGTGRLSSRDPNIQNIPHRDSDAWRIRRCFVPPVDGWVFSEVDYSQLERRIQAIIWDDEALIAAYAAGLDTHAATAARMFNVPYDDVTKDQRNYAKTAVYGQSYGMGPDKYRRNQARNGNYISMAEARSFLDAVSTAHPGVALGQRRSVARAQQAQMLRNNFGRIRWFLGPEVYGDAMNFLPQSNAADIMLTAMVTLWKRRSSLPPFVIVAQIHDSLLLASPPDVAPTIVAATRDAMEQPFDAFDGASFPTDAKTGGLDWSFKEDPC